MRCSLAQRSGGAYDVTVGPLVDLWGFGPDPASAQSARTRPPLPQRATAWAGKRCEVDSAARRARKAPGVRVDLSSLGKGRGVDRVAEYLDAAGVSLTTSSICPASCARAAAMRAANLARRGRAARQPTTSPAAAAAMPADRRAARSKAWPPPATTGAFSKPTAGTIRTSSIRAPGWPVTHAHRVRDRHRGRLHAGGCAGHGVHGRCRRAMPCGWPKRRRCPRC